MNRAGLADRISDLEESATLALNARVKRMASEGATVYNLTAGELACETPQYIQKEVAASLYLNKYTPVPGLPRLRDEIAAHARNFYGISDIKTQNVVVTAGAKPALYASLLSVVNPGDEVIVPTPAWVSYHHLISLAGGKAVDVPLTESYDLDPSAIEAAISDRTKAIIINSPHNPTGAVYSADSLTELSARLKGSSLTVIADDIYTKLVFDSSYKPVPTYGFDNLVIVNGFSKSQAITGWRIGYLLADESIAAACIKILSHTMGNAAVPSQLAALAALTKGDRQVMLKELKGFRDYVCGRLETIPGIGHNVPGGAFYIFLDLRKITDNSLAWCEELLDETGVALVPGEAFNAPGYARLSYVAGKKVLEPALVKIEDFVKGGRK